MKYPNNINKNINNSKEVISFGNRGMDLENDLNLTNNYYKDIDKAFIYKKPVPIKVTDVDYKSKGKTIRKAYFESPSTTDYNGLYKGRYIDFEAKETNNKTSFPLMNIHKHQIDHIRHIDKHNGICFLIVRFKKIDKTYLLFSKDFLYYIDNYDKKSISVSYFEKNGHLINFKYQPRIDYLEIVDKYMEVL